MNQVNTNELAAFSSWVESYFEVNDQTEKGVILYEGPFHRQNEKEYCSPIKLMPEITYEKRRKAKELIEIYTECYKKQMAEYEN